MQKWLRLKRLLPLFTLIVGSIAAGFSILGLVDDSNIINSLILTVLVLIAGDTLIERIDILERIEKRLSALSHSKPLLSRDELPALKIEARSAREIVVLAISGLAIAQTFKDFFENRLDQGSQIKVLLVDPRCSSLKEYKKTDTSTNVETNIRAALPMYRDLLNKYPANFAIKYSDVVLPYSLIGIDIHRKTENSYMTVEIHGYKVFYSGLPSVFLSPDTDLTWFDIFKEQFNTAWKDAGEEWSLDMLKMLEQPKT